MKKTSFYSLCLCFCLFLFLLSGCQTPLSEKPRNEAWTLSELENRVWWQYVTGVPVADIARDLARDERSVHNAIYRIRRKLRAVIPHP